MKRLGPELKMPKLKGSEMKVPPFLSDLYYDLRDRRLLPIVALILVAIVAAPFLLGGGSGEPEPVPVPSTTGGATASGSGKSLTVVQAQPGLRNYRKRLAHRRPTDPFKQRFTGPDLKGAGLNTQTESSSSSTSPTFTTSTESSTTTTESSPGGSPSGDGGSGSGGGGPQAEPGITFFAYAIDVRITKSGGNGSANGSTTGSSAANSSAADGAAQAASEPTVRHGVLPLTKLPGDKAPVVTYMGPSKKGNALFLVSGKVKSVFGELKCVSGDDSCQLIEVSTEFPVTFVYGANEVHYTLHVLKMELVVTGHARPGQG